MTGIKKRRKATNLTLATLWPIWPARQVQSCHKKLHDVNHRGQATIECSNCISTVAALTTPCPLTLFLLPLSLLSSLLSIIFFSAYSQSKCRDIMADACETTTKATDFETAQSHLEPRTSSPNGCNDVWDEGNVEEMKKTEFSTVEDAHEFYNSYAHRMGFATRIMYEKRGSKTNKVHYIKYACNKEGFRKGSTIELKNNCSSLGYIQALPVVIRSRSEERTGCGAYIRLQLEQSRGVYVIKDLSIDHNHELHPKEFCHMLKTNRRVSCVQGVVAEMHEDAGIRLRSSFEVMALGAGGRAGIGFLSLDLKNHLARRRQRAMARGEATALQDYFRLEAFRHPSFFYDIEVDSEEMIANIFWADERMKLDYSFFGDSITFDTTYRTNKNYCPVGMSGTVVH